MLGLVWTISIATTMKIIVVVMWFNNKRYFSLSHYFRCI